MNNRKIAGIIAAVVGVCALITLINSGMNTPILSWPLEAYLGVAFTIGWLSGAPAWLAYVLAALVFILEIWVCYKVGSWVYGLVAGRG